MPPLSFRSWVVAILLLRAAETLGKNLSDDLQNLAKEGVVPDVIPIAPPGVVAVRYARKDVLLGNVLTPAEARFAPNVYFEGSKDHKYTVIMVDPDAPRRAAPSQRHWLHWLLVDLPYPGAAKDAMTAVKYMGPTPPRGTGLHRYVFLVYDQGSSDLPRRVFNFGIRRGKFSLADFLKSYGLKDLVAANFFYAQTR